MRLTSFALSLALAGSLYANELTPELESLVNQRVEQILNEQGLTEPDLQDRIERGIEIFIQKQQQAQREAQEQAASGAAQRARAVSADRDYIRGDESAEYSLIEYSDFECTFCKRFHDTALTFTDSHSNLNWVYRHFPLENHNPLATLQAEAAECAGELAGRDGFWQMTDTIVARTRSGGRGMSLDDLGRIAGEIGLDQSAFDDCFDSRRHQARVQEDMLDGQQAGINGTPGNILRHNPSGLVITINGAQPLANLEDAFTRLQARVAELP